MRATTLASVLIVGLVTIVGAVPAAAQSCQELWVQRNSIYKANGYCFKTQRGIAYFGNGGCLYDNEAQIPMSPRDRARIADITRAERAFGCR